MKNNKSPKTVSEEVIKNSRYVKRIKMDLFFIRDAIEMIEFHIEKKQYSRIESCIPTLKKSIKILNKHCEYSKYTKDDTRSEIGED